MSKSMNSDKKGIYTLLHQKFLEERKIFLWKSIDDKVTEDIVERLLYLDMQDNSKEITFYINTPGGSVTGGMAIYDTMKLISSPITVVVTGLAASMGSILLQGPKKGKRLLYPNAQVLIHQPLISGVMRGPSTDLEIHALEMEKTRQALTQILADGCGRPYEEVYADCDRDHYFSAQEAIEYGLADKIVTSI